MPPAEPARLSFDELASLIERAFLRGGVSPGNARILGANCAMCERDGSLSHGIFRLPGYLASLKAGWVDGQAIPDLEPAGSAFLRVDARNGFAQPALAAARSELLRMVREGGAAILAIRRSHHFSALWPDIEGFAEAGLIAFTAIGGTTCVAPFGSTQPMFGTNPIAFAAPVANGEPFIFDQATSALSNGDVRIAARDGHSIGPGMAIDGSGQPTTDPNAVLAGGALLPFGGHKGAALSMMVEILAAALTGGQFSHEVDFSSYPGAETPSTGQLLIAIDPDRGQTSGAAASRIGQLMALLRESGVERLPGDRRRAYRLAAARNGIPIDTDRLSQLREWAG